MNTVFATFYSFGAAILLMIQGCFHQTYFNPLIMIPIGFMAVLGFPALLLRGFRA